MRRIIGAFVLLSGLAMPAFAVPHLHDGYCIALAMDLVSIDRELDALTSSASYASAVQRRDDLKRAHDEAFGDYIYAQANNFSIETVRELFDAEVAAYEAWRDAANVDIFCDVEELEDDFRRTLVILFQHCPLS